MVFAMALGLLNQKLKARSHNETKNEKATLQHLGIPLELKTIIEREARKLSGYRQGGILADEFMTLLAKSTAETIDANLKAFLLEKNDPRITENH